MGRDNRKRAERIAINWKTIIVIALVAVVFGALMGYRAGVPFGWRKRLSPHWHLVFWVGC
jgi:hypothetical protein